MKVFLILLGLLSVICQCRSTSPADEKKAFSVTWNTATNSFSVSNKYDEDADAYGYYTRNVNASNWNYLDAHAQSEVTSRDYHLQTMRALGFLEGYATCETIQTFYGNFYSAVFGEDPVGAQTINFLRKNYDWLQDMAQRNAATDDYWYTVKTVLQQTNGLFEGYVAGCSSKERKLSSLSNDGLDPTIFKTLDHPTLEHFLLLNAWGDLYQIALKYWEPGRNSRLHGQRKGQLKSEKKKLVQRCSAIIKVLPDLSDVVFGHTTWDSFESLGPRIIKHMSFPLLRNGFAEHHYDVYFSSSPGLLSSVDDFFTVSGYAQLAVIETTNELYNVKLLDKVVPQSVLSWTRAITSHQMATSGADWAKQFARYQSGTYTNQWMALDLRLFTPGQPLPANFLTIFEEVPGLVHIEDLTAKLASSGYWSSYNIPYFEDIYEASGNAKACERNEDDCYDKAPRALLFAEYQQTVVDVYSAEKLLSYNNWQKDAASKNDSCDAIACRGDLEPNIVSRGAFGSLDTKVSTALTARRNPGEAPVILARLGPTHYDQPVFCWSRFRDEPDYVHNGQPDCFDFAISTFPPSD